MSGDAARLIGKGGHMRTVPVPDWVKAATDSWASPIGIESGILLRSINKAGRIWGNGFTPKVIWSIVKQSAVSCGLPAVAPHDLRRTCARLCHQAGGELEQIQFLLVTFPSRQLTVIFDANSGSATQLMTTSV
jgi:site-specific recombinase XerD